MNAQKIIEAALDRARSRNYPNCVISKLEEIGFAGRYVERGYSTAHPVILFGNWNGEYDAKGKPWEKFVPRIAKLLERVAELEWSDEWAMCSDCQGAFRTSPDSYGWLRSYVELDGEQICHECASNHAESILEEFEGSDRKALTRELGIDPAEHGYTLAQSEFENGLHDGQASDPKVIAASLRKRGITRFLFRIDSAGQFDLRFSLFIHDEQMEKFSELKRSESDAEISPAELMKRGLREAALTSGEMQRQAEKTGGIVYTKIADGKAESRVVSREELIKGIKQ